MRSRYAVADAGSYVDESGRWCLRAFHAILEEEAGLGHVGRLFHEVRDPWALLPVREAQPPSSRPGGRFALRTSSGTVAAAFPSPATPHSDRDSGVVDMLAGPSEDTLQLFPTRVVPLGDGGSAFTFTMFQTPGQPDEQFREPVPLAPARVREPWVIVRLRAYFDRGSQSAARVVRNALVALLTTKITTRSSHLLPVYTTRFKRSDSSMRLAAVDWRADMRRRGNSSRIARLSFRCRRVARAQCRGRTGERVSPAGPPQ
jgi:hypothetical protein